MLDLLHSLIMRSASASPQTEALVYQKQSMTYAALADSVSRMVTAYINLELRRSERVAVYLEKRFETVIATFGAVAAGGVFVPINPLLKPDQVAYILRDCNVRILVTSVERLRLISSRRCVHSPLSRLLNVLSSDEGRQERRLAIAEPQQRFFRNASIRGMLQIGPDAGLGNGLHKSGAIRTWFSIGKLLRLSADYSHRECQRRNENRRSSGHDSRHFAPPSGKWAANIPQLEAACAICAVRPMGCTTGWFVER